MTHPDFDPDELRPLTPERAELITTLGARVAALTMTEAESLAYAELFAVLGLAVRGIGEVAARQMAKEHPALSVDEARKAVLDMARTQLKHVMSMPDDLIKIDERSGTGPVEFGAIPAVQH